MTTFTIRFLLALLLAQPANAGTGRKDRVDQVKAGIHAMVSQKLGIAPDGLVIEYTDFDRKLPRLAAGQQIQILPSKQALRRGIQLLSCGIYKAGQLQKIVKLKIRVRTFEDVVVSARRLGRHAVLGEEDILVSRRETTKLKRGVYPDPAQALGKRTRRLIQAGEILTEDLLEPEPVVKRGSRVEIEFRKGALRIVLPGIARQDGKLDDVIRVKCVETRKEFRGQIVAAGTVVVNL